MAAGKATPGQAGVRSLGFGGPSEVADFAVCLSGPGGGLLQPDCVGFDLDASTDVDLADFAAFAVAFGG